MTTYAPNSSMTAIMRSEYSARVEPDRVRARPATRTASRQSSACAPSTMAASGSGGKVMFGFRSVRRGVATGHRRGVGQASSKPSWMSSASSSRSSSGRNADAAAFSWNVSKSSRS